MTDDFPYLGELDGLGDQSRPAMFMHNGNKYQVKVIYHEASLIEAYRELFGPDSVESYNGGYAISIGRMIIPKFLIFKPSPPNKPLLLRPSGGYSVREKSPEEPQTILLDIDEFIQVPDNFDLAQISAYFNMLHNVSFSSDYLRKWLKDSTPYVPLIDKSTIHFDIPSKPDEHKIEITKSGKKVTLNFRTEHTFHSRVPAITIGASSSSVVSGDNGQSFEELQQDEISIIRLLCIAFGRRITIYNLHASYTTDGIPFVFHTLWFNQFEQLNIIHKQNRKLPQPLFSFSDISAAGIQKWFNLERTGGFGLLSLISAIALSDCIPLENQIMDCCSAASYLKVNVRNPKQNEPGLHTTIFYLCADVLGLPEAKMTNSEQAENNSPEAHHTSCWSKSIARYNNSLKHGDYKPKTETDVPVIQDAHTAAEHLIEFKLMLRFWIALQLGCTRKQLQGYLRNMNYQSPLGDYSLFTPWFKKNSNNNSDSADKRDATSK